MWTGLGLGYCLCERDYESGYGNGSAYGRDGDVDGLGGHPRVYGYDHGCARDRDGDVDGHDHARGHAPSPNPQARTSAPHTRPRPSAR